MPEDGTGVKLTVFLQPLELGIMKWGLARRFGPLNGLRSAEESPQVSATASGMSSMVQLNGMDGVLCCDCLYALHHGHESQMQLHPLLQSLYVHAVF